MKSTLCIMLALAALFTQGCATSKEPIDNATYDKVTERQINEDYQERLKP